MDGGRSHHGRIVGGNNSIHIALENGELGPTKVPGYVTIRRTIALPSSTSSYLFESCRHAVSSIANGAVSVCRCQSSYFGGTD